MTIPADLPVFAFSAERLIARGPASDAMPAIHAAASDAGPLLVFDAATGRVIDLDLRGTAQDAAARLAPPAVQPEPERRGPGRPKLGVAAREVTLLPRHWDWLSSRPGGASVALRKLVEAEMKAAEGPDRARKAQEAAYRFMTTMAGDRPGYEEATRRLFAGDGDGLQAAMQEWPQGVREIALDLAQTR